MSLPELREDVYFVPIDGGVCFVTSRGSEVFTGKTIHAWLQRLAPYLDGRHELHDLTRQLSADRKKHVEGIVTSLLDRGLARDRSKDRPHSLGDAELRRYASEISYIDSFCDSAAWRFQTYQNKRFVVVGTGEIFAALVYQVLQSGARHVTAVMTTESATDVARIRELVHRAGLLPPELRQAPGDEIGLVDLCAEADLLFHVSSSPMLDRVLRLDAACSRLNTSFLPVFVLGNEAWIGPVCSLGASGTTSTGASRTTWESAWRRHRSQVLNQDSGRASSLPPTTCLEGVTAALVAAVAGLAAFRHLTGIDTSDECVTCVDLTTLTSTPHRFVPHPLVVPIHTSSNKNDFLSGINRLRAGESVDAERLGRRVMTLIDEHFGVFTEISERSLAQVPLSVALASVTSAHLDGAPQPPHPIVGAGLDSRTARSRAALRGLAYYASTVLDPRRLTGSSKPAVWAYRLADGSAQVLDVAIAYQGPATSTGAPGSGVAAGHTWEDALLTGLLSQCCKLAVAEAVGANTVFPRINLDGLQLDDEGTAYVRLLQLTGMELIVYDITEGLGVLTLAFCVGKRTVAYASGRDFAEAVRHGLDRVLLDYQAQRNGHPKYGLSDVPQLPRHSRGNHYRRLVAKERTSDDMEDMLKHLAESGHDALVVPLDHDPRVSDILPYIVNVVVRDA